LTPLIDFAGEQANEKQFTTGGATVAATVQTCPVTFVFDGGDVAHPLMACGMCCRNEYRLHTPFFDGAAQEPLMLPPVTSAIAAPLFRIGHRHDVSGYDANPPADVLTLIIFGVPSAFMTGVQLLAAHSAKSPLHVVMPAGSGGSAFGVDCAETDVPHSSSTHTNTTRIMTGILSRLQTPEMFPRWSLAT
jgi:hypothetical protein